MELSIIKEAAKGDVKAFKTIFDYYVPRMRPVALRYAHTEFEADDILQESFVKIFHYLKDYKFEGSFEGWVRRIVVNTAINNYKKNINYNSSGNFEDLNESELGSEDPEEIGEAEPSAIMKAIEDLPDGYKMVFNLYVIEDLSHKEIGELLNISEGTSRSQYSKARKMLKKLLSRQRNEEKRSLIDSKDL